MKIKKISYSFNLLLFLCLFSFESYGSESSRPSSENTPPIPSSPSHTLERPRSARGHYPQLTDSELTFCSERNVGGMPTFTVPLRKGQGYEADSDEDEDDFFVPISPRNGSAHDRRSRSVAILSYEELDRTISADFTFEDAFFPPAACDSGTASIPSTSADSADSAPQPTSISLLGLSIPSFSQQAPATALISSPQNPSVTTPDVIPVAPPIPPLPQTADSLPPSFTPAVAVPFSLDYLMLSNSRNALVRRQCLLDELLDDFLEDNDDMSKRQKLARLVSLGEAPPQQRYVNIWQSASPEEVLLQYRAVMTVALYPREGAYFMDIFPGFIGSNGGMNCCWAHEDIPQAIEDSLKRYPRLSVDARTQVANSLLYSMHLRRHYVHQTLVAFLATGVFRGQSLETIADQVLQQRGYPTLKWPRATLLTQLASIVSSAEWCRAFQTVAGFVHNFDKPLLTAGRSFRVKRDLADLNEVTQIHENLLKRYTFQRNQIWVFWQLDGILFSTWDTLRSMIGILLENSLLRQGIPSLTVAIKEALEEADLTSVMKRTLPYPHTPDLTQELAQNGAHQIAFASSKEGALEYKGQQFFLDFYRMVVGDPTAKRWLASHKNQELSPWLTQDVLVSFLTTLPTPPHLVMIISNKTLSWPEVESYCLQSNTFLFCGRYNPSAYFETIDAVNTKMQELTGTQRNWIKGYKKISTPPTPPTPCFSYVEDDDSGEGEHVIAQSLLNLSNASAKKAEETEKEGQKKTALSGESASIFSPAVTSSDQDHMTRADLALGLSVPTPVQETLAPDTPPQKSPLPQSRTLRKVGRFEISHE